MTEKQVVGAIMAWMIAAVWVAQFVGGFLGQQRKRAKENGKA